MFGKIAIDSFRFCIQNQNLKDYRDAYLFMLGGALLIIIGILLAVRFYLKERKAKMEKKFSNLNIEINEITQRAGSSIENYGLYGSNINEQTTADMDTNVSSHQDYLESTELMEDIDDITALPGQADVLMNSKSIVEDETLSLEQ